MICISLLPERYFASTFLQSLLEWTATFEGEAVAMDTLDAAAVGWVDAGATSVVDVADEKGFADFTDITKFSWYVSKNIL